MHRRQFLISVGSVAGWILWRAASTVHAEIACTPFNQFGIQQCEAGISSSILDVVASDTQHATQWCWAACIQAIFAYYDHDVPQERIVKEAYGAIVNMPGSPAQILTALNRRWRDEAGDVFRCTANAITSNAVTAAQDLAADHPLIIGTLGHAMVLTSLQYARDAVARGQVMLATVRDPWPLNPRRRTLNAQEWYSINFAARIRVEDL